jgi:solute carrier family 25 oxoglutarate transporter 11
MDNFKLALKTRSQYAVSIGLGDIAVRIATYRWLMNGWQRYFGGFESNHIRKIPGAVLSALLTSPFSVPLEIARMTYYADKTFPKELQRGYTSYFNALFRIPFEEGPYWLFKNSFPFIARNFF